MVTVDGRLVHVDFGYALGKEPLDSVLIHFAVQGFQPSIGWQGVCIVTCGIRRL